MFTAAAFATVDLLELHALVRALKYNRNFANKYSRPRQIICDIILYHNNKLRHAGCALIMHNGTIEILRLTEAV